MRLMKHSFTRCVVLGSALLCLCASVPLATANDTELPAGISIGEREDGRNQVQIEFGSETVFIDVLFFPLHQGIQNPKFMIQTGDGDRTVFPESHISLVPDTRLPANEPPTGTFVTIRSGFTMSHADRQIVIFSFGRLATQADAVIWLPTDRTLITGRLCDRDGVGRHGHSPIPWRGSTCLSDLLDLEPAIVIPGRGAPGGAELLQDQTDRLTRSPRPCRSRASGGVFGTGNPPRTFDAPWFSAWLEGRARRRDRCVPGRL